MRNFFLLIGVISIISLPLFGELNAQQTKKEMRCITDSINVISDGNITVSMSNSMYDIVAQDTSSIVMPPLDSESLPRERHVVHKAGYRIQVFSDNNQRTAKNQAQNIATMIGEEYPSFGLYLTYKAPYWRLRVGDFLTEEEARETMSEMRRKFPSLSGDMRVVRERIKVYL